ncbi:conserved hypothetical protein [Ktedonobacter racemifer DSM 44963]|uniref:Uncharacterized protein n=2 Tax=Ktedonobacter racemifer TaxID=363277 RepID=D6TT56_KTERA|nr:conserved hypothetical protein [Ktedonobacter racemifer DSM 44963]
MTQFLHLDHLRYEVHILGPVLFFIPLALVAVFVGLTGMFLLGHVVHILIASLLIAALEACLPLAAGIILSTVAVQDASLELLLTLPVSYRRIVFLRFALILGWTLLVEWGASLALSAFLPWVPVKPLATFQLTWLAPSLWLSGACILLALLLRNQASSGAILGCVWIMQLLFHGFFAQNGWAQPWFLFATLYTPDASFWLTNRLELIATALVLFAAVWWFLRDPERRFFGEDI